MEITRSLFYIGTKDKIHNDLIANSYLIKDDKIAIIDTVHACYQEVWLENIEKILQSKQPDYFILSHIEEKEIGSIHTLVNKYPHLTIITTSSIQEQLKTIFPHLIIAGLNQLSLGNEVLTFLHYIPDMMMIYLTHEKILLSSYVFGTFGGRYCLEETKRYYFYILGQYGLHIQQLLKRMKALGVQMICPLHGHFLKDNIREYMHYYNLWSQYLPTDCHVLIVYASHFQELEIAKSLSLLLQENGESVVLRDLRKTDMSYLLTDAFSCDRIVFVSSDDCLPEMLSFVQCLKNKKFQNHEVAFITNKTRILENIFMNMDDVQIIRPTLMLDDFSYKQLEKLADSLINGGCTGEFCD